MDQLKESDDDIIFSEEIDILKCKKIQKAPKSKILARLLFQNQSFETTFLDTFPKFMASQEFWEFLMTHVTDTSATSLESQEFDLASSLPPNDSSENSVETSGCSVTSNAEGSLNDNKDSALDSIGEFCGSSGRTPLSSVETCGNPIAMLRASEEASLYRTRSVDTPGGLAKGLRKIQPLRAVGSFIKINDIETSSVDSNCSTDSFTGNRRLQFTDRGVPVTPKRQVLRLITLWISNYYEDFVQNTFLTEKLEDFCSSINLEERTEFTPDEAKLLRTLKMTKETFQRIPPFIPMTYETQINNFDAQYLSEVSHESVSLGLTLIDMENWRALRPRNLIEGNYYSEKKCPNILRLYQYHDQIYTRTIADIVYSEKPKDRAVRFRFWTKVIESLVDVHNYNSSLAIFKALVSIKVAKLPKTFSKIHKKAFDSMARLKGILGSSDKLRRDIAALKCPYIPFLNDVAITLRNLEKIYRSNNNDPNLIELGVCDRISSIINNVRMIQSYRTKNLLSKEDLMMIKKFYSLPCPKLELIYEHMNKLET